ncbi:MAG TPA: hypothetical protein VFA30_08315 [Gaiellaceae bacterium]|nr:hypothetical protein [Gaiellaceae bacterium]
MASWFHKLFRRSWQPQHPPRPTLTPEEEPEPQERRTALDEPKTTPDDDRSG